MAESESTPLLGDAARFGAPNEPESRPWYNRSGVGIYRVIAAGSIVVLVLVTAVLLPKTKSSPDNDAAPASDLCLTPACIHAASGYLTNLSPDYKTVDPCTDFEQFVCAGWRDAHDLRADQGRTDALGLINDDITSKLRNILEGSYPDKSAHSAFSPQNIPRTLSSSDRRNFEQLQEVYHSCMDVDTITKRGIAPIVTLLDELAATFKKDDYSDSILYLEKLGVSSFFGFGVGDDEKNPERQLISVSPNTAVGLPSKEYFQDKDVVDKYAAMMGKVLGAIKPTKASFGSIEEAVPALVKLESDITAIGPDRSDLFDVTKTYNLMPVKDTAALVPQFGLDKVLKALVPGDYHLAETVTAFPEILANVSRIVADTPTQVVHNYLYWRVIVAYSGTVMGSEIKPFKQFQNVLQGKDADAETERWRTCVGYTDGVLGWVLSRFFVEASFSAAAKDFGNQIISDIKAAYLANFAGLAWMDEETKTVASQKVKNIDQKVGYPSESPDIMDPEELREYYEAVDTSGGFFETTLSSTAAAAAREWASVSKPTDMKEWGMTASTVNAYYNPPHNEIVFPAGIMQFPLFSVDLPSYVSYGAFGAVAGHELSHAFDNNGRHYDLHGRYNNWWTNATIEAFTEKAECIVQEFNNFTVDGKDGPIHINGRLTLGENIADSGGLTAARTAWDARRKTAGAEQTLPGLDGFTHEQMFYISYGNAWCSKWRPEALTNIVQTNEHSPDMVRIKGTIANSRGFKEAFNCPVKEPTCELW